MDARAGGHVHDIFLFARTWHLQWMPWDAHVHKAIFFACFWCWLSRFGLGLRRACVALALASWLRLLSRLCRFCVCVAFASALVSVVSGLNRYGMNRYEKTLKCLGGSFSSPAKNLSIFGRQHGGAKV